MERWVPLFDIFLNSPTPESEASIWLQNSFDPSPPTPITTASFLSLLTEPVDAVSTNSTPFASHRVMFIQTLPGTVQCRVLSFLGYEHEKFSKWELRRLAESVLRANKGGDVWAESAARHLLDRVSDSGRGSFSGLSLGSTGDAILREFTLMPDWLKDVANEDGSCVPWLPLLDGEVHCCESAMFGAEMEDDLLSEDGEVGVDELGKDVEQMEIDCPVVFDLGKELQDKAVSLGVHVMNFVSNSEIAELASDVRNLCLEGGGDPLLVLGLIEPWNADDETASVLLSHLCSGVDDQLSWPGQVLCSVILPKMLLLEEAASRVLVTAVIEYCKLHKKAAEYALLLPLLMRRDGINKPIYDVVIRIVKECLHAAHVSAFCQKLVCGGDDKKGWIFLPCHRRLLSDELIWTESLFNLLHDILNLNVQFTKDCIDHIVLQISAQAPNFSSSLKFGNFFLRFLSKCTMHLRYHKPVLVEAANQTNTFLTKSIVSKLSSV